MAFCEKFPFMVLRILGFADGWLAGGCRDGQMATQVEDPS